MRLVEFNVSNANSKELAALSQFLTARAQDTNAKKQMSVTSFLNLASNMGISLTGDQLRNLIQQPPLNELIANIEADPSGPPGDPNAGIIVFKGGDEVAPNMSVDQARETVNQMAKRAASKPGL